MKATALFILGLISISTALEIFVSPKGNDTWSGLLAEPRTNDGPIQTLGRAQSLLRELKQNGSLPSEKIFVNLREGDYRIQQTWSFTADDSGLTADTPIIYRNYNGEKVRVLGSVPLSGWTKATNNAYIPDITNVWQVCGAPVATVLALNGNKTFHSLFVNGRRAVRSRIPNNDDVLIWVASFTDPQVERNDPVGKTGFVFRGNDLNPNWYNLDDVNLIYYYAWTTEYNWIKSIHPNNNSVYFHSPASLVPGSWSNNKRYYVENVLEGLDSPREWYLDAANNCVYYYPTAWEDMDSIQVEVPLVQFLMRFDGAANIQFQGIEFANSDWQVYRANNVVFGASQSATDPSLAGTIYLTGTSNIGFDSVTIANTATYGVYVDNSNYFKLTNSHLHNLGAGGVWTGGQTSYSVMQNNYIHTGSRVFYAGAGILIQTGSHNVIKNNEISDLYYTAVSLGWQWNYGATSAWNNSVTNNYLHHIGQNVLSDMGGTYTLGVSPLTEIKQNHIHTIYGFSYGGWGAYNDEGSSHIVTSKNIIWDTNSETVFIHYGANLTATENVLMPGAANAFQNSRDGNNDWDWTIYKNTVLLLTGYAYGPMTPTSNWTANSNLFLDLGCPFGISARYPESNLSDWRAKSGNDLNTILQPFSRSNVAAIQNGDTTLLPKTELQSLGIDLPDFSAIGLQSNMLSLKQSFKIDTCRPRKDYNFDFEQFSVAESWGGVLYTVNHDATLGPWIDDKQPSQTAGQRSLWFYSATQNSPAMYLQPTRQMDGTTDVTFDLFLNSTNAGFLVNARGQWGGPQLLIQNQNLTLSGVMQKVVVPVQRWLRFSFAVEIGNGDYTYSMLDLTTQETQTFTVPSTPLCTFGPFLMRSAGAAQTSVWVDNIGVNARGPTVSIEQSAENTVRVKFDDNVSDLCGLDLFVDNALFKRFFRDELVNLNEVSVQLTGVQLGEHNVYAVAKSDRNHVASSVLSLQVVPEKTPTDSPQSKPTSVSSQASVLLISLAVAFVSLLSL